MPISRKRHIPNKKNKKHINKPYQAVKQQFVRINNPISPDIPFDDRIQMLCEIGKQATDSFEKEYQNLKIYLNEYDPLYLCSFCARYFGTSAEGIDEEAIDGRIDFPPFFLEILQCLSLTCKRNLSSKLLDDKISDFKSSLSTFCRSQGLMQLNLANKVNTQDDVDAFVLRSDMMGQTTAVRNWAYVDQMQKIAYDLADLIEPHFSNLYDFTARDFLDLLFSLAQLTENKLNSHIQKTREFIQAKTYNQAFDKYEENFPSQKKTDYLEREKVWENVGRKIKILRGVLLADSDIFLSDVFTHNSNEIYNHLSQKISEENICKMLDKISLQFGELSDINKEYIFLDNPIHAKPFIKIDHDRYFSAIPHMFTHLGVDILERLLSIDVKLKNEYASKKGKYLETKVAELFRESFPKAKIFSGSTWRCPITNKNFENDLLVQIEDFAIIIESKSGTVPLPAKRGAPDRLFKTLRELVVAPSEQAIRFETYLSQNKKVHKFKTKSSIVNTIDSTNIKYYIPLGVTLSNLGSIGCNLKKLINAQVTNYKIHELAPSISLTDLEVIFEILTLRAEKLHYLSRRREFEAHLTFEGDEMDLFAFYLETGFNIGEAEFDETIINFTLKSKELDPYFIGKSRGKKIKRPSLQKSDYWNEILVKLDSHSPYWLLASYILLNVPKNDQIKFERNLHILINRIVNRRVPKSNNWMVMICGPKRRRYAIVGFPYKDIDKATRNNLMNEIVVSIKENQDVRGIVILGYDLISTNYYPYSVIVTSKETDFFDNLES